MEETEFPEGVTFPMSQINIWWGQGLNPGLLTHSNVIHTMSRVHFQEASLTNI